MNILMSASIPDPKRNEKYWTTADNLAIRDAVIALAQAVLKRDTLVFGGHPAITPIVRSVAENYDRQNPGAEAMDRVRVYQSKFFEKFYLDDLKKFRDIVETPAKGGRETSLDFMRHKMVDDRPISAAFFIGGMEGVEDEYRIAGQKHPPIHLIPIASTGAAAQMLADKLETPFDEDRKWIAELRTNRAYLPVFQQILNSLR